jgi:uncharacterized membrane protein
VVAARPGPSRPIGPLGVAALAGALLAVVALALLAVRLRGATGSVVLGALAGAAFGAGAIASRPLADSPSGHALTTSPLLYLLIAHSVLAQLLLALAMQRGSTTSAVAAMDAASAVPAALVGVAFLGDRIRPGCTLLGCLGFVMALLAVVGLTKYARPQPRCPASAPVVAQPVASVTGHTVGQIAAGHTVGPAVAVIGGQAVAGRLSGTGELTGLAGGGALTLGPAGRAAPQGDQEADHRRDPERAHRAGQRAHQPAEHPRRVPVRPDRHQQRPHPRPHPQHQQPDGRQVPGPARP